MALSPLISCLQKELKIEESEFPESHIGNEGLIKRILRKGLNWQTPSLGDQVEGSYTPPTLSFTLYAFTSMVEPIKQ